MNTLQFPQEVLHIRNEFQKIDPDTDSTVTKEQEVAFDNIVAWCASKQLFMGGNALNAVVYSPFGPIDEPHRLQLRGLLTSMPGISACHMRVCWMSALHATVDKATCLEAIGEAQSYLAGKTASCTEALRALYKPERQNWHAWVDPTGAELILAHRPLEISLTLRRLDGQPVPKFARFAGTTVGLTDIEILITDWLRVHWKQIPQHPSADLSTGRWEAQTDGWRVWITGNPSAQLSHRDVMLRWMGALGAEFPESWQF